MRYFGHARMPSVSISWMIGWSRAFWWASEPVSITFGARRGKLLGNVRLAFRPPSGRLSQSAADKIGVAVGLMA
jgi:hypothetical protein